MSQPYNRVSKNSWEKCHRLSFEAKSIYHYVLTSPHRNAAGFFRLPLSYISEDTGACTETILRALNELEENSWIMYSEDAGTVLILNNAQHDPPSNPNQGIHRVDLWDEGVLPTETAEMRRLCLLDLADAIENVLQLMRDTQNEKLKKQRSRLKGAVTSMRREAECLDHEGQAANPSERASKGFFNYNDSNNDIGIDRGNNCDNVAQNFLEDFGSDLHPECRNREVFEGYSLPGEEEPVFLLEHQLDVMRDRFPQLNVDEIVEDHIHSICTFPPKERPRNNTSLGYFVCAHLAELVGDEKSASRYVSKGIRANGQGLEAAEEAPA